VSGNAKTASGAASHSGEEDVFSSSGDPARGSASLGQKLALSFSAAADGLFAVLFPSLCRFCARPLTKLSRVPVCDACLDKIQAMDGPLCAACGERVPGLRRSERDAPLCNACSQEEPAFTRAAAYGSYDAGMRELIHLLKYDHVRPAAALLGRMLAEVIAGLAEQFDGPPVVIPVPLHRSKLRQRGFNQSELIAGAALKLHPAALDVRPNVSAMVRCKNTDSQTGLTPSQRRENMRGAFVVVRPEDVRGRDILLIDDVMTTGTTASECARVLRRAGANKVLVATVARVLKPEPARVTVSSGEEVRAQVLAAHV
jgi:ComF family protein